MNELVVIAGPTACGKTAVSVETAKIIGGEIISADSMQVYKYMDIGTAKIKKEEMQGIRHYLIDELYPDEEYNISVFKDKTKKYIEEIYSRNKIPMIVGGTGFYINAAVKDTEFEEEISDKAYREELENMAREKGPDYIYAMLKECDPDACKSIHKNNIKRVIRALEYYKNTGEKISEHNKKEKEKTSPYNLFFFVLNMNRDKLYDRIEKRIDIMIEDGLVAEVNALLEKGYSMNSVAMQGLGYKEIAAYLCGKISFDEAVRILKRDTRRFAKRQITWFKHQCDGDVINVDEYDNIKNVAEYIANKIKA